MRKNTILLLLCLLMPVAAMSAVCNSADMKGEGKAKGSFTGDRIFTSTYELMGTMHGTPVTQRQETSGKWRAADCGAVQPMGDFKQKK